MTTPLSDERIADMREFWAGHEDGDVSDDRAVWRFAHQTSLALLAEVERLRSWLRECSVAMGGDGSDDSLLGLVYCCGAGNEALKQIGREQAEVDRLRARVAALEGVLRSVEWGGGLVNRIDDMDGTYLGLVPTCPKCLELKSDGHAPDCELAAALREQVTWILVDVRMPAVNQRVLGVYRFRDGSGQQWAVFSWHPESGWWDEALDEPLGDDCEMVYWMAVPILPDGSEEACEDATE